MNPNIIRISARPLAEDKPHNPIFKERRAVRLHLPRYAAAALLCLGVSCIKSDTARVSAPDFMLPDLNGTRFYLNAYRGAPVLLNFWSVYCVPCRLEMPLLEKLNASFRNRGVVFAGICSDNSETIYIRGIADSLGLTYPQLLDRGANVSTLYSVDAFPTTIIIDKDGRIVYRGTGFTVHTIAGYKKILEELCEDKPPG